MDHYVHFRSPSPGIFTWRKVSLCLAHKAPKSRTLQGFSGMGEAEPELELGFVRQDLATAPSCLVEGRMTSLRTLCKTKVLYTGAPS